MKGFSSYQTVIFERLVVYMHSESIIAQNITKCKSKRKAVFSDREHPRFLSYEMYTS